MKSQAIILAISIAALLSLASCGGSATKSSRPEAAAHEKTLTLTAYSRDVEVYAEVTPLVAGQPSAVVAHFSRLDSFKPLTEGAITVRLIAGGDSAAQALGVPERPGVYRFTLQPAAAGVGTLVFAFATPDGASQVAIPGIRVHAEAQHDDDDDDDNGGTAPGATDVVFTKEQSWKVDFATEEVAPAPFGGVIKVAAKILPAQGDERVVAAQSSGMVAFGSGSMVEGKAVGAGQTLFAIESEGLADNSLSVRYAEAESEYRRAKAECERKEALAQDKIASESELLKAQTELANAEAAYRNLRKNFSAGRQIARSPVAGFVRQLWVRNGEFVTAGQAVATIAQNRDLLIRAELQPKYYGVLGSITSANIRPMGSSSAYSLEELGGALVAFGKAADPANPLIPVFFQVKNSAGLLPGAFVELYIKTQTSSRAITLPNEALVEEMGAFFVFVQRTPELFEKRPVRKGATDGFRTEITEGIAAGERVVSKGAILLKLAQAAGGADAEAGHTH
ncbi:MAG: efflux RND transporter periplasmic adaptor subunit [Prevotellaceae bacterium]|jgi:RND family efflux transporter MFP subunit|nr:efflux RND transporter periplasmic adaptor subunit [Prevotellaceae bacterium]